MGDDLRLAFLSQEPGVNNGTWNAVVVSVRKLLRRLSIKLRLAQIERWLVLQ